MIERYAMQPLKDLWNEENQYKRWLEVEVSVVKAFEKCGQAPAGTAQQILSKAVIDVQKIHEIEAVVDHDVIAFINCATQNMGDEARYFHKGMTSSDVVDTALSLALKRSGLVIKQELEKFEEVLKEQAFKYKDTITIGRTHGIHAEPTSFGLKLLSYLAEVQRNKIRLDAAIENISYAKISGAVGNYANIDPEIEKQALHMI
ncbi:MAG TPA: lyase family protein, partial [Petrotogaceae bacterium]|nr:lyase family protein [Petrotogaceae bacterium]